MTDKGESMSPEGEIEELLMLTCPCFQAGHKNCTIDRKDLYTENRYIKNQREHYELSLKDIHIWYGKMTLEAPQTMTIKNNEPFIQMIFSVKCNGAYNVGEAPKTLLKLGHYQHNLILVPAQDIHVEWQQEAQLEILIVNISLEFFMRYLPDSILPYSLFQDGIEKKIATVLSKQNLIIKPKILNVLYDIIHCEHKGCYKKLFVESKVIELLTIQLEQEEHIQDSASSIDLKKDEIEKMHQAREIILNNLENPLSLSVLARQVGTNVFNLKKHFKQIYGTTVFGFIHAHRMENSKEMLKKGDLKIVDIAKSAGYKHATHFTMAFKKYFGYLPNKIRG